MMFRINKENFKATEREREVYVKKTKATLHLLALINYV